MSHTGMINLSVLPDGVYDYEYDVAWRLRGNRSVSQPRTKSNESTLFVDELPALPNE